MPKAVVLVAGEIWEDMNGNIVRQERIFRISGNNKGLVCPFKPIVCPGGHCLQCQIYLDWLKLEEKVVICLACGKVMYRISDFGRSVLFLGLCDECDKEGDSQKVKPEDCPKQNECYNKLPEFREYARQKYPKELDEDLITTIEDLIERQKMKHKGVL